MHHPQIKHTIEIFEIMYKQLPPLVPDEMKKEMEHALEHLNDDYKVGVEEVENIVIALGKKIWPYWKAFGEFYNMDQGKLGEKFLLGKLPIELKKKYNEFKEHGGTYHDLRSGSPAVFFEVEERLEITQSLIEVDIDIREHTRQSVLSIERKKYEDLIIDFQTILDDIEKRLDSLRLVAEDEEEHPELAEEIRAKVRAFEFGLCLLGPNSQTHELENAEDYFVERREFRKHFGR